MCQYLLYGGPIENDLQLTIETRNRCLWVAEKLLLDPISNVVLCAGIVNSSQRESLAQLMKKTLLEMGVDSNQMIIYFPQSNVCESVAETKAFISYCENVKVIGEKIIVSSWYHIPRLRLLWWHNMTRFKLNPYTQISFKGVWTGFKNLHIQLANECVALSLTLVGFDKTKMYMKLFGFSQRGSQQ